MKKMRIPLLIALGVAVIGIILGSFLDLNLSQAIASPTNYFALTVSAIGPTLGFAAVAIMGGGFIAFAVKGKYHIGLKILFIVLAAACYFVAIWYPASEYFGINGFYGAAPEWAGYLIVAVPEAAAVVGGYFIFKDNQNKNLWIVFLIMVALLLIVLLGAINILKGILHRPRFRLISAEGVTISFHQWWEPCKNYEELKELYHTDSDNFKSFPSGHTAEAAIAIVPITFLPLAHKRYQKIQMPAFLGACALVLLVALARIMAAAHFLSDVSFGALLMITFLFIANEVVTNVKALQLKEEEPAPTPEAEQQ